MMERARRLRVRSTQPGLRGSRETPPGPTTWVRPATGWWRRMNAGESPRNQGRSVWAPLSVSRRRSRGLRKTPRWSAERRAGPRYGPAVPSRWRDGRDRKVRQWVRRSAPANFGAPLPSDGDAKGSKPTIWHDSPPGCAARQRSPTAQQHADKKDNVEMQNRTSARTCDARLLRGACHRAGQRPDPLARNDVDGSVNAVIARSAQRDEQSRAPGGVRWSQRQRRILAKRTREVFGGRFGETNPRSLERDTSSLSKNSELVRRDGRI